MAFSTSLERASDAKNACEGVKVFEADLSEDLRKFDVLPWFCSSGRTQPKSRQAKSARNIYYKTSFRRASRQRRGATQSFCSALRDIEELRFSVLASYGPQLRPHTGETERATGSIQGYFGGLSRNTFLLAAASLFADISTKMLYPVLPVFLTQTLSASGSIVGLVDGFAQATHNIVQGFSGTLSDKLQK